MSESLPSALVCALDRVFDEWKDVISCAYVMAYELIKFYLGDDWASENVKSQEQYNMFMLNNIDEVNNDGFTHMHRVVELGDILFSLRKVKNFDLWCKKLRQIPTYSFFLEASIARNFISSGFTVTIVKESKKKGEDFDFLVEKRGLEISVEITSKNSAELSSAKIRDTLRKKESQVPDCRPAILFLAVPETWIKKASLQEPIYAEVINNFFSNHSKYNAVVLVWNEGISVGEGMVKIQAYRDYHNPAPKHPIDLSFLIPDKAIKSIDALESYINHGGSFDQPSPDLGNLSPSFYRWYIKNKAARAFFDYMSTSPGHHFRTSESYR